MATPKFKVGSQLVVVSIERIGQVVKVYPLTKPEPSYTMMFNDFTEYTVQETNLMHWGEWIVKDDGPSKAYREIPTDSQYMEKPTMETTPKMPDAVATIALSSEALEEILSSAAFIEANTRTVEDYDGGVHATEYVVGSEFLESLLRGTTEDREFTCPSAEAIDNGIVGYIPNEMFYDYNTSEGTVIDYLIDHGIIELQRDPIGTALSLIQDHAHINEHIAQAVAILTNAKKHRDRKGGKQE